MANDKLVAQYKEAQRIDDTKFFCCELTGITTRQLAGHHIVKRSQQGDESRENIICLDYWIHDMFHAGYRNFAKELEKYGIRNVEELWARMGGKIEQVERGKK